MFLGRGVRMRVDDTCVRGTGGPDTKEGGEEGVTCPVQDNSRFYLPLRNRLGDSTSVYRVSDHRSWRRRGLLRRNEYVQETGPRSCVEQER